MLRNYLKVALRSVRRHKGYSLINITGLAIGMACCILILLWVQNELSYDRFHEDVEDIFRVSREFQTPEGDLHTYDTSALLGPVLKEDFPEVLDSTLFISRQRAIYRYGEKVFYEEGRALADPSLFDIFTFPVLKGDPKKALEDRNSIIITEKIAKKYFEDEDPVGKILNHNNWDDYMVAAVVKDIPQNSHIRFDIIQSFLQLKEVWPGGFEWDNKIFRTYVKLRKNVDHRALSQKITDHINRKYPGHSRYKERIHLIPLTRVHLYSLGGGGIIRYVYIFSLIAAFILFIACINFMNLSTARFATRAKEVGMRKVVGASRLKLILQFYSESILMAAAASVFALILVELFLPAFNQIAGINLAVNFLDAKLLLGFFAFIAITGIAAGSYPALYLSSFNPVGVLKGTLKSGTKGSAFQKILVVTQFALSIGLIIGTAVVHRQLDYLLNKDLGFDKDNVVYIRPRDNILRNYESFKNELLRNPSVLSVTIRDRLPTKVYDQGIADWPGRDPEHVLTVEFIKVEFDYFKTLNIKVKEGRVFEMERQKDIKEGFILNEEAVQQMGLDSPIGKQISVKGIKGTVIGVVEDAHLWPRQERMKPEVYQHIFVADVSSGELNQYGVVLIKLKAGAIPEGLTAIENMWRSLNPNYPYEFHFLDEALDAHYKGEMVMRTVADYFSILAIIISCLGLFGLASYMVQGRTKEIGVRKVLGASVSTIIFLLTKEFTKWILLANLIAWPIAYFALDKWLKNYAYRISINAYVFFLAGAGALFIALLTVGFQAVKAARTNPVDALRYE